MKVQKSVLPVLAIASISNAAFLNWPNGTNPLTPSIQDAYFRPSIFGRDGNSTNTPMAYNGSSNSSKPFFGEHGWLFPNQTSLENLFFPNQTILENMGVKTVEQFKDLLEDQFGFLKANSSNSSRSDILKPLANAISAFGEPAKDALKDMKDSAENLFELPGLKPFGDFLGKLGNLSHTPAAQNGTSNSSKPLFGDTGLFLPNQTNLEKLGEKTVEQFNDLLEESLDFLKPTPSKSADSGAKPDILKPFTEVISAVAEPAKEVIKEMKESAKEFLDLPKKLNPFEAMRAPSKPKPFGFGFRPNFKKRGNADGMEVKETTETDVEVYEVKASKTVDPLERRQETSGVNNAKNNGDDEWEYYYETVNHYNKRQGLNESYQTAPAKTNVVMDEITKTVDSFIERMPFVTSLFEQIEKRGEAANKNSTESVNGTEMPDPLKDVLSFATGLIPDGKFATEPKKEADGKGNAMFGIDFSRNPFGDVTKHLMSNWPPRKPFTKREDDEKSIGLESPGKEKSGDIQSGEAFSTCKFNPHQNVVRDGSCKEAEIPENSDVDDLNKYLPT